MSDVFPKWTNRLPLMIIIGALLIGTGVTAGLLVLFHQQIHQRGLHARAAGRVFPFHPRRPVGHGLPLLP